MEEFEVKFLNIDKEEMEQKLKGVGAEKSGEYFYRRRIFDYPDFRLDKKGSWLRLRDEGERITLSFKQRLGVIKHDGSTQDTGMEEIEVIVSDFEKTADLLLHLGFIEKHYAENKRTRYIKDGVEFDIDTFPKLQPYLEIEASSWEKVNEAIKLLNLREEDKKIFSTNQIYSLQGIEVFDYVRIAFDGLVKRNNN